MTAQDFHKIYHAMRGPSPRKILNALRKHQVRDTWDGLARWHLLTYDKPVKAVSVQVDPERVLLLDTNYTNNSRTLEPVTDAAATKWSLRWMVWLQDLLMTCAFLI